ncbi:MAG: DUF4838 domain-containing protein [Chloroflexota bacterium]
MTRLSAVGALVPLRNNPSSPGQVGQRQLSRHRLLGAAGGAATAFALRPLTSSAAAAATETSDLVLVAGGHAQSVIVLEEPNNQFVVDAANELRAHIALASGAELDLIGPQDPPGERVAIHIGRGRLANAMLAAAGVKLEPEQYWIKAFDNKILIVGSDIAGTPRNPSAATLWAADYLLDLYLGVRWFWPGEGGTYVPKRTSIAIPSFEVVRQPSLLTRSLRNAIHLRPGGALNFLTDAEFVRLSAEGNRWLDRHQMGQKRVRGITGGGHAFTQWWGKYAATHPDYFAETPEGFVQPWPVPDRVKLRVGNPAVAERVIQEWQAAGAPDYWGVAPNDSAGFDISDASRALDFPQNQPIMDIWLGRANLSARYVRFWNVLLAKMRQIKPNAHLSTYAYSSYRLAPPPESGVRVAPGTILGFVAAPWFNDEWQGWSDAGGELYLRPNWWHAGADAPLLPLHLEGNYFTFTRQHRSVGFDFDSILGFWGTQGLRYYLIARLSARPDLTVDDVIDGFVASFGPAASAIRDYVDYWETFTNAAAYPYQAGGTVSHNPDGLYETVAREHGITGSSNNGSYRILPYLFTDDVLAPAFAKLDEAAALAAAEADSLQARIAFLKDGLTEMRKLRDILQLGYRDRHSPEFATAAAELRQMRIDLTSRHVVWGEVQYWRENEMGIPTFQTDTVPGRRVALEAGA